MKHPISSQEHIHKWRYLNKRKEGNVIISFCSHCDYIDGTDIRLQKLFIKKGDWQSEKELKEYVRQAF